MSDALDVTITLDDVFAVVQAKRVPLAPELAGYLSLEIAENSDAKSGDIDPRSVYIAEEGTVVLVKPRSAGNAGSADASIRVILARLLEASGSQTPALASAARRRPTGNMRSLIEELEAALIPVNRAAGRRALARLAREVKRVTLGVGRNAQVPASARGPSASQPGPRGPEITPRHDGTSAAEPRRGQHLDGTSAAERAEAPQPRAPLPETPLAPPPHRRPVAPPTPYHEEPPAKSDLPGRLRMFDPPTPVPGPAPPASGLELARTIAQPDRAPEPVQEKPSVRTAAAVNASQDVDSLLAEFEVSHERGDHAVARDLKAMVGLDPTPPPPDQKAIPTREVKSLRRDSGGASADAGVESLLAMSEPLKVPSALPMTRAPTPAPNPPPLRQDAQTRQARPSFPGTLPGIMDSGGEQRAAPAAAPAQPARPAVPAPSPSGRNLAAPPTAPTVARSSPIRVTTGGEIMRPKKKAGTLLLGLLVACFLVVAVAAVALVKMPAGFLTGRTAEKIAQEKAENEAARDRIAREQQAAACRATLEVTDIPAGAEVLLRVGQAPVDIDHMPVGARLEFVATAEGFAPKRTVVPAGAVWDPAANGKPRFEVAVQLEKLTKPKGDLWPAGEAGSQVGGQGPPGTVHIVSSPRGAEVWLLAGIGPEARVEQLIACGADADVLVAGPTTFRKRLHVAATDFVPDTTAGPTPTRTAKLSAR